MSRNGLLLGLVALCLAAAISAASAERRVALVIGNSGYSNLQQLTNPTTDAADMAATLASIGYEVIRAENLTKDGFRTSAQEFLGKIVDAETALLYYAGHAVQVQSVNYLLPVDAIIEQPTDVLFNAVPLQDIVRLMEQRARVSVVLVDACRDNPFGKDALPNATRSIALEQGLAAENASDGSYLAFAAQPGKPSYDGNGRNSPFTAALIDHIAEPGVDIRLAMADVRESVAEATGYRQIPWESSSLVGRYTLNPDMPGPGLVILPADESQSAALSPPAATIQPDPAGQSTAPADPAPATNRAAPEQSVAAAEPRTDTSVDLAAPPPSIPIAPAEQAAAPAIAPPTSAPASPALGQSGAVASPPAAAEPPAQNLAVPAAPPAEAAQPLLPQDPQPVEQAALSPGAPSAPVVDVAPDQVVTLVQEELIRIGCLAGSADGVWGPQSRSALGNWVERRQVKVDRNEATVEALGILRGERGRICPVVAAAPVRPRASAAPSRSAPTRKATRPSNRRQPSKKGYFGWQPGGGGVQFCTTCPDS